MLAFDPSSLKPKRLSELKERQLFLQRDMSRHVLGIVVAAEPSKHLICHLNGKHAFHLESINTRMARPNVIAIPMTIDELSLRIDTDSTPDDLFAHATGRLVVTADEGPSVIVKWPDRHHDDEPYVLKLPQWELSQIDRPAFGFERWSLSHLDKDGSWQPIVDRRPPTPAE
ncbi:hypothetical protein LDO31_18700 [Luteimonas sp. XNQY3]|nr:hypothetical protein [Luteimonas sp. XNQY3]MCD9008223.1 hypothetical protein [Luteimonas sp. XNQY3]